MKKKNFRLISFAIITILIIISLAVHAEEDGNVYVIPIKGNITKATYQFVEVQISEAIKHNPSAIIFEIDTYGGYINEAEKIWRLISSLDVPTISYVNTKAESAGVLITLSSERIVMASGGTIGSAETIPNTEKVLSMWVSWLREAARNSGRNPEIAASMADKSIEIPGVVKKGKLLNLNSSEAIELGFIDFITDDYKDILDYYDIEYNDITTVAPSLRTKVASILSDPVVGGILIILGFVGLVIEVMAPGFGAGGTLSFIAFALFFSGNVLAGNSGWGVVILFIVGIILLGIEAVIPSFGITGIGGIVAIGVSIVLAMNSLVAGLVSITVAIIVSILILVLLIKYGYKSPYLSKVILKENQDKDRGYVGVTEKKDYLGREGEALSFLRPAGTIQIDEDRLDALSDGEFIEKGSRVKVIKVQGSKIIVRKI